MVQMMILISKTQPMLAILDRTVDISEVPFRTSKQGKFENKGLKMLYVPIRHIRKCPLVWKSISSSLRCVETLHAGHPSYKS